MLTTDGIHLIAWLLFFGAMFLMYLVGARARSVEDHAARNASNRDE